ncbi:MAG: CAP domain-containing protein [Candidatus Methylacidiphilales bacterium]
MFRLWFILVLLLLPALNLKSTPLPVEVLEREIFQQVNQERAKAQRYALHWSPDLHRVAIEWADHLARLGRLEHRRNLSTLQKKHGWHYLNENLYAFSATPTAARVVKAWMNSPGHRKNLLAPQATQSAVALRFTSQGEARVVFHAASGSFPPPPPRPQPYP